MTEVKHFERKCLEIYLDLSGWEDWEMYELIIKLSHLFKSPSIVRTVKQW